MYKQVAFLTVRTVLISHARCFRENSGKMTNGSLFLKILTGAKYRKEKGLDSNRVQSFYLCVLVCLLCRYISICCLKIRRIPRVRHKTEQWWICLECTVPQYPDGNSAGNNPYRAEHDKSF